MDGSNRALEALEERLGARWEAIGRARYCFGTIVSDFFVGNLVANGTGMTCNFQSIIRMLFQHCCQLVEKRLVGR